MTLSTILAMFMLRRKRRPFPPGPRGLPILGNIQDFTCGFEWIRFGTSMKHHFGDVLGFRILRNTIVVLNSAKAARDLLDKRGHLYSSRPVLTVVGELMGLDRSMPLLPYGSEWRKCRKLEHIALNATAVKQYRPMLEHFSAMLALDILGDPDNFYELTRLCASRIILSVTYGLSARVTDSEYITLAEDTMRIVTSSIRPGAYLCDLIPIMKYLPGWVPFQREARHGRNMIERFVYTPFERAKEAIAMGSAGPSLTRDLLTSIPADSLTTEIEERIKWTTGALLIMTTAGGESTFGTLAVFMIAMAVNRDKQIRAQEEIDSVIGAERLPNIPDRGRLPYVDALIQEVMRWHPILPLSITRRADAEDEYEGYVIPKDTIVSPNLWAIAMEPNPKYPPEQFIPERFLDKEYPTPNPTTWAFGFGRRICPGKTLAEESVFVLISTLLATLDIQAPPEGLVPKFESRAVCLPKRFNCVFKARSLDKFELLRGAAAL
ncbi:uncharacterized protein PHACADRAFT_164255 [Phanerochaete carnosa HHB-10118-sp]|uniref:Cytochrome P450 n=1 Tax=Phanerochaete carnosa (strain HHB-10118-sp) TaxID=650164 RepID=K5VLR0_PHACS|nr:uncharacterized protein PHACADRAFT_164255 [Phanerochaete carnosa HHB-10118-sp]EKM52333.1 hypothetical protein PHACADRAFT_164255 [Phanerochaete carnosa HHB-10118-sp]